MIFLIFNHFWKRNFSKKMPNSSNIKPSYKKIFKYANPPVSKLAQMVRQKWTKNLTSWYALVPLVHCIKCRFWPPDGARHSLECNKSKNRHHFWLPTFLDVQLCSLAKKDSFTVKVLKVHFFFEKTKGKVHFKDF